MLPFHMLDALPTQPSFGLDPIVPLFPPLFSVTSATSAVRSPRSPIADFCPHPHQPNRFPLFPHPVNIARAGTPANPFPSIVYFTTSGHPGGRGTHASRLLGTPSTPRARTLAATLSPLDATLTQMHRGPRASSQRAAHYSLLTTHFPNQSATLFLSGKRYDS
jgi:hypothetical protein